MSGQGSKQPPLHPSGTDQLLKSALEDVTYTIIHTTITVHIQHNFLAGVSLVEASLPYKYYGSYVYTYAIVSARLGHHTVGLNNRHTASQ